jgi:hypothetical protein
MSNYCDCPPPGGRIECDSGDVAFCVVDSEGRQRGGCLRVSGAIRSALIARDRKRVAEWLLDGFGSVEADFHRISPTERARFARDIFPHGQLDRNARYSFSTGHEVSVSMPEQGIG